MAATVAAAAAVVVVPAYSQASASSLGCGSATQRAVNTAYLAATLSIYDGELQSSEVTADARHVTRAANLASAVAADDVAATLAATTTIVYHPAWHIVRLRVLSSSGRVLADVGGPYILAPVTGKITFHGKLVGSYVMSVQDDLGYEKLVTRFTHLPIEIYRDGQPLIGRDFAPADVPAQVPAAGSSIIVGGVVSVAVTYSVKAFPTGQARVLIAVPRASAALAASNCTAVSALTYAKVAEDTAKLLNLPGESGLFVGVMRQFDPDKLVFVREGSTQLASTGRLSGPASIPTRGIVSYEGQSWFVVSFVAVPAVRVYLLFPDSADAGGSTGSTGAS
jgi:hypothetical protein